MTFQKVRNFEQMENGKTYSYGKSLEDQQVFTFEYKDYFDTVVLNYKDGYVANPPVENFKRHIDEGKVYEHI